MEGFTATPTPLELAKKVNEVVQHQAALGEAISGAAAVRRFDLALPAAGWTGTAAPYTQTVQVPGLLATDRPHLGVSYSGSSAQQMGQSLAAGCITRLVAEAGRAVFTCFFARPTEDLSVFLEVMR